MQAQKATYYCPKEHISLEGLNTDHLRLCNEAEHDAVEKFVKAHRGNLQATFKTLQYEIIRSTAETSIRLTIARLIKLKKIFVKTDKSTEFWKFTVFGKYLKGLEMSPILFAYSIREVIEQIYTRKEFLPHHFRPILHASYEWLLDRMLKENTVEGESRGAVTEFQTTLNRGDEFWRDVNREFEISFIDSIIRVIEK